jgi:hypothetical protein
VDSVKPNPIWPVDLDAVRVWPMEVRTDRYSKN